MATRPRQSSNGGRRSPNLFSVRSASTFGTCFSLRDLEELLEEHICSIWTARRTGAYNPLCTPLRCFIKQNSMECSMKPILGVPIFPPHTPLTPRFTGLIFHSGSYYRNYAVFKPPLTNKRTMLYAEHAYVTSFSELALMSHCLKKGLRRCASVWRSRSTSAVCQPPCSELTWDN